MKKQKQKSTNFRFLRLSFYFIIFFNADETKENKSRSGVPSSAEQPTVSRLSELKMKRDLNPDKIPGR